MRRERADYLRSVLFSPAETAPVAPSGHVTWISSSAKGTRDAQGKIENRRDLRDRHEQKRDQPDRQFSKRTASKRSREAPARRHQCRFRAGRQRRQTRAGPALRVPGGTGNGRSGAVITVAAVPGMNCGDRSLGFSERPAVTLLWGLARGRRAAAVAIEMACRCSRLYRVPAIVVDGTLALSSAARGSSAQAESRSFSASVSIRSR